MMQCWVRDILAPLHLLVKSLLEESSKLVPCSPPFCSLITRPTGRVFAFDGIIVYH